MTTRYNDFSETSFGSTVCRAKSGGPSSEELVSARFMDSSEEESPSESGSFSRVNMVFKVRLVTVCKEEECKSSRRRTLSSQMYEIL